MKNLTLEQIKILRRSINDFPFFVENIYSLSFENFISGDHPREVARKLQQYNKTLRVSAKDHFKSASAYAHFMWELLKHADSQFDREYHYFSYTGDLSSYHISKIKSLITVNPFYEEIIDYKKNAEGVIRYSWDNVHSFSLEPQGLLKFKRGLHANGGVYVDDPFQDPDKKIDPVKIRKINNIMRTQILDIPNMNANPPAFLHIFGTAQTKEDFFFDKTFTSRFHVDVLPAIVDRGKKTVLWKEWRNFEELLAREYERGKKIFAQEYLCQPAYEVSSFFTQELVDKFMCLMINRPHNQAWKFKDNKERDQFEQKDIVGGWDLGKKVHPANFKVFEVDGENWTEIHSKWFDGVDYIDQLAHIEEAIEALEIDQVYYDNTRGELEALVEKNQVPPECVPVVLSSKKRKALSTLFDQKVERGQMKQIDDQRAKSTMLAVQDDLDTIENESGHGESFWTTCLALQFEVESLPQVG